ncbi:MAG: hypothetical protein PVG34_02570 [Desulfobacterales bacterium]|jgi:hypothetical protein
MKVNITFCGPLARYAGIEKTRIELPEIARFEDLMSEIGHTFGQNMPPLIWDPVGGRFTHHVLVMKGLKQLTDPKEPLEKGEEIKFFLIMVGG